MYTKEQIRHIAEDLVEELREMEDGTRISSVQLLQINNYDLDEFGEDGLFDFDNALRRAAKANHIFLDMSEHEGLFEGLPYNLDFIVKNKRAQIKCPRCGSKNTARILYGMPAFSMIEKKLDEGKIFLGGCDIIDIKVDDKEILWQPSRHCNQCKKDFGMPPVIVDKHFNGNYLAGEDYRDIVESIEFSDGGYFGGYTDIKVKRNSHGAYVTVSKYPLNNNRIPEDKQITELRWNRLVNKLYTELYLHEWKKRFDDPSVLDGEQWELTITLTGNRKRTYYGSNDFPPYWPELKALFRPFTRV